MTPQYKAMMKKLRSNTVKETTQATRNIRKYKRKIETAPKGKMVTDDYGNKLSVKKKPDGTFGRRHTLSQGRKRAIALGGDSVSEGLMLHAKKIKNHAIYRKDEKVIPIYAVSRRHATSAVRRRNLGDAYRKTMNEHPQARKRKYHSARIVIDLKKYNGNEATAAAKELHKGTKRKPKDFTK